MNPTELVTGISVFLELGATYLALFITVISAYLFVAYSVGKELKKSQTGFISTLFVVFSILLIVSAYRVNLAAYEFEIAYAESNNTIAFVGTHVGAVIQLIAVLGSLLFMRDIRKSN